MTRHRPHAVLLLFLLLIFATPAVGQEAGQRARGEIIPASIHFVLFPTSTVEGLLTPDLLGLEMEDGTIVARDDLINPEYFASLRPNFFPLVLGGGVAAVVGKFILDQVVGVGTCAVIGSVTAGSDDCLKAGMASSKSYAVNFGLSASVLASLWVIPSAWRSDWKPW
jgi:hypothetical protein